MQRTGKMKKVIKEDKSVYPFVLGMKSDLWLRFP